MTTALSDPCEHGPLRDNHYLIAQFAGTKACSRYDLPLYCSTVLLPVMVDQTSVFGGFVAPGSNTSTTVPPKRKCKRDPKQRKRLREKRELSSNTGTSTTGIDLGVQDAVVAVKVIDQSSKKKMQKKFKAKTKNQGSQSSSSSSRSRRSQRSQRDQRDERSQRSESHF